MKSVETLIFASVFVLARTITIKSHSIIDAGDPINWLFADSPSIRVKRNYFEPLPNEISERSKCRKDLARLCMPKDPEDDILQCIQSHLEQQTNDVASIDDPTCQHDLWISVLTLVNKSANDACGQDLDRCSIRTDTPEDPHLVLCLIDRSRIEDLRCSQFVRRLERIILLDLFGIAMRFLPDCKSDIDTIQCGRIHDGKTSSPREGTLTCLQLFVNELKPRCRKRVLRASELQADDIRSDRQLYAACSQDRLEFCPNVRLGGGRVYECLMHRKMDQSMTKRCRNQLIRREKLIALDYKVSQGLAGACLEDIRNNHCRRSMSENEETRLARILLCLESASRNGSEISSNCRSEMFDHRKILMEDYGLSPEMVDGCSIDISNFCNGFEAAGKTIHCLMERASTGRRGSKISDKCERALDQLLEETDAGEDWRIDPVLREACQPVVDVACRDIRGGDARVISCLMEKLDTNRMTEACETALLQIQHFVARDFELDPRLYKACKSDAVRFCHAGRVRLPNDGRFHVDKDPSVLPCLYGYAYRSRKNATLKSECLEEIRRVTRQRAISVDLQPEIEEACLDELSTLCYKKNTRGKEISCLQDNFDSLNQKCKLAIGNLTEVQAEHVELNPVITTACRHAMKRHCEDVLTFGKDEGDMMECLIEHKNDLDPHSDYKCGVAIEHFQLISLKNYRFTYKFKEACKPYVVRWCPRSQTKVDVIECLGTIVREDAMKNTQHRIPKECRQQLRAQLYQQRENIQFDPVLQRLCSKDIDRLCREVHPGSSQILECLALHKIELSDTCRKRLFKVRKQEFQDSSTDFFLLNACRRMVRQFCHDVDRSYALDCLKQYKDDSRFDDGCKSVVVRRMIEQNTDYRFNVALQSACSTDIDKHCKTVLIDEPLNKELEGKVIKCLKIQFREARLTTTCESRMADILREAALNYHLNPLLAMACAREVETICRIDNAEPGIVEECLKTEFNARNERMTRLCRLEVADFIEQAKADINVDPLLQKACAIDVGKYCNNVPQGAGRHIVCLQYVLQDKTKSLQPECHKMFTTRIEMFKNAAQLIAPNTIEELYTTVNRSPARRYFMIVTFTVIGLIFIIGLFCGRVTRRTIMMKNK